MSNTKLTSKKTTAMVAIIAMLALTFSVMGITTEEAHAAAAKKPAKVASFKVSQSNQKVTVAWKKAAKVKVGSKKYAPKYQLETKVTDIFGASKTTKTTLANSKVKKAYTNHPGTKYTVRIRAFYTKSGKKVYGAWTAKKSITIKNTGKVKIIASRYNNKVLGEARYSGPTTPQKYEKYIFTYNGKTASYKLNDSDGFVQFDDAKAGTMTVYAQYTAKSGSKTKVVKTAVASEKVAAAGGSNNNNNSTTSPTTSGGNSGSTTKPSTGGTTKPSTNPTSPTNPTTPSTGGGSNNDPIGDAEDDAYDGAMYVDTNGNEVAGAKTKAEANQNKPYISESVNDISGLKVDNYDFGPAGIYSDRNHNHFVLQFNKDVTGYTWKFYPTNNKTLVNTLGLDAKSNYPKFVDHLTTSKNPEYFGTGSDAIALGSKMVVMKTNWQCTDGYVVGFDKSGKEVYCTKLGWRTQVGHCNWAPGDVSYGGPYYNKCVNLLKNVIFPESGADDTSLTYKQRAQKLVNYLQDKMTWAIDGMDDEMGFGFFFNKTWLHIGDYNDFDIRNYDYSGILAMLLGVDGTSCWGFEQPEAFILKQLDPNVTLEDKDLSSVYGNDHRAVRGVFSDGTAIIFDLSNTDYRGNGMSVKSLDDLFNSNSWRDYLKKSVGPDACEDFFGF